MGGQSILETPPRGSPGRRNSTGKGKGFKGDGGKGFKGDTKGSKGKNGFKGDVKGKGKGKGKSEGKGKNRDVESGADASGNWRRDSPPKHARGMHLEAPLYGQPPAVWGRPEYSQVQEEVASNSPTPKYGFAPSPQSGRHLQSPVGSNTQSAASTPFAREIQRSPWEQNAPQSGNLCTHPAQMRESSPWNHWGDEQSMPLHAPAPITRHMLEGCPDRPVPIPGFPSLESLENLNGSRVGSRAASPQPSGLAPIGSSRPLALGFMEHPGPSNSPPLDCPSPCRSSPPIPFAPTPPPEEESNFCPWTPKGHEVSSLPLAAQLNAVHRDNATAQANANAIMQPPFMPSLDSKSAAFVPGAHTHGEWQGGAFEPTPLQGYGYEGNYGQSQQYGNPGMYENGSAWDNVNPVHPRRGSAPSVPRPFARDEWKHETAHAEQLTDVGQSSVFSTCRTEFVDEYSPATSAFDTEVPPSTGPSSLPSSLPSSGPASAHGEENMKHRYVHTLTGLTPATIGAAADNVLRCGVHRPEHLTDLSQAIMTCVALDERQARPLADVISIIAPRIPNFGHSANAPTLVKEVQNQILLDHHEEVEHGEEGELIPSVADGKVELAAELFIRNLAGLATMKTLFMRLLFNKVVPDRHVLICCRALIIAGGRLDQHEIGTKMVDLIFLQLKEVNKGDTTRERARINHVLSLRDSKWGLSKAERKQARRSSHTAAFPQGQHNVGGPQRGFINRPMPVNQYAHAH